MTKLEIVDYPDDVMDRLYAEFTANNESAGTFEEYCFIHYGQYVTEYYSKQEKLRDKQTA